MPERVLLLVDLHQLSPRGPIRHEHETLRIEKDPLQYELQRCFLDWGCFFPAQESRLEVPQVFKKGRGRVLTLHTVG